MIVVAGEALIDLIVDPAGGLAAVPGGGPYNSARTIARLGRDVTFLGRISNDRFGRMLREPRGATACRGDRVVGTDDPTTLAVAELDQPGPRRTAFTSTGPRPRA